MTENLSLSKSIDFTQLLRSDFLQGLVEVFPNQVLDEYNESNKRARIFTTENTILSMVYTATQEDKSLQNSVFQFQKIHERQSSMIVKKAMADLDLEKQENLKQQDKKKMGRPKTYKTKIKKSLMQSPSANTAAYSKARSKLKLDIFNDMFAASKQTDIVASLWYGRSTYITDGTVCQMQDSKDLRKQYNVISKANEQESPYPQALLQGIIQQGTGMIWAYELGNRNESELSLLYKIIQTVPKRSVLLADDLYNTYAIFHLCRKNNFDIIVPGKRIRNYKVIKQISEGDEIVEIKKTKHPTWLPTTEILPTTIQLRRITFTSTDGKLCVLYTTILDCTISKTDIVLKYFTRWDIEISIREIKTMMHINVLRSKTKDMIEKELAAALIAYNLLKKIIFNSTQKSAFSPQGNIFQKFIENYQNVFIDNKGRVYNRWSSGRYGKVES